MSFCIMYYIASHLTFYDDMLFEASLLNWGIEWSCSGVYFCTFIHLHSNSTNTFCFSFLVNIYTAQTRIWCKNDRLLCYLMPELDLYHQLARYFCLEAKKPSNYKYYKSNNIPANKLIDIKKTVFDVCEWKEKEILKKIN